MSKNINQKNETRWRNRKCMRNARTLEELQHRNQKLENNKIVNRIKHSLKSSVADTKRSGFICVTMCVIVFMVGLSNRRQFEDNISPIYWCKLQNIYITCGTRKLNSIKFIQSVTASLGRKCFYAVDNLRICLIIYRCKRERFLSVESMNDFEWIFTVWFWL